MKHLNMDKARERLFGILYNTGNEYFIETLEGEIEEVYQSTNDISVLIDVCKEVLDSYYDDGHENSMGRYAEDDPEDKKHWHSAVGKLKRFINTYSKFIGG